MPVDLQPKLLRVLQEKVYYRVGSDKPQEADFRLISSTNRDPFESIKDGSLREDLYYRINTIEIKIPPLRDRMEDVPMLAEHFLQMYAEKYKQDDAHFSELAYNQMLNYNWRGNVRELQHSIERAVLLCKTNTITELNIPKTSSETVSFAYNAPSENSQDNEISFNHSSSNGTNHEMQNYQIGKDLDGDKLFEEVGKIIVENLPEPADGIEQKDVFDSWKQALSSRLCGGQTETNRRRRIFWDYIARDFTG